MAVVVETMLEEAHRGRKTLVVGLGQTGLSCARYLQRLGAEVAMTDTRLTPPALETVREELPETPLFLGDFSRSAFEHADQIVVSPGVSRNHPMIRAAELRGAEIVGDVELFARAARAPVIAITGSNGKSTVTTWVGEMARAAGVDARVGGNLGTPVLELLSESEPDFYVLELSSFQLETTESLAPAIATVLNISPDHMDRYDSFEDYAAAKQRALGLAAIQIINADDAQVLAMADSRRQVRRFTLGEPSGNDYGISVHAGAKWLMRGAETVLPVAELRVYGRHNVANALAALAIADAMGLAEDAVKRSLKGFAGLPHRMQWVAEINGVSWINDSKGTNPGATCAALQGMESPVVLIAGGTGKDADFSVLRDVLAEQARGIVLFGRDAELIESIIGDVVAVTRAKDLEEAVLRASQMAQPGDSVLLSPACASFDMFRDYAERGDMFIRAVRRLAP